MPRLRSMVTSHPSNLGIGDRCGAALKGRHMRHHIILVPLRSLSLLGDSRMQRGGHWGQGKILPNDSLTALTRKSGPKASARAFA